MFISVHYLGYAWLAALAWLIAKPKYGQSTA
jgi:hypothetical protein